MRSIANSFDAATVSNGRRRLPPPTAAWRIASNSRSRLSPVGASNLANKLSTSAETRGASVSSSWASRSMLSTGIEGLEPCRLAVAAECDLLDARLRVLEASLAMPPEPVALLVEVDRLVERRLALLERAHDLFEAPQRILEAQLADVGFGGCHGAILTLGKPRINSR